MKSGGAFILFFLCGSFAAFACSLHSKDKPVGSVLSFGPALEDAKLVSKMGPASGNAPLGPVSKEGGIEGLYPLYGNLMLTESVAFRWSGKDIRGGQPYMSWSGKGKPAYLFIVENKEKENERLMLFPIQPKDREMKRAVSELGLKKGKSYHWYLGRIDKVLIAQSRVFSFRTLSSEEEKNLDVDLKEIAGRPVPRKDCRNFLKAQVFYKYAMYHDMVEILHPLYNMAQTEPVKQLLFLGNVRLGRYGEAKKFK